MNTPVKWVAELAHVREVSLFGIADLAYWEDRLRKADLHPAASAGQAQLLLIAADSRFKGVRFRELSFCVLVSWPEEATSGDGAYLVEAFNSSRLFAFCERVFFATPYRHADVRVSASFPPSIQLVENGDVVFQAKMHADPSAPTREALRCGEEGWKGPVFLPGNPNRKNRQRDLFFARIKGFTRAYPFFEASDSVTIKHSPNSKVLEALVESHFSAKEWIVREDAAHARSKTYRRTDFLPSAAHA